MSDANFFDMARSHFRTGIAELDRKWGWYSALGVFLIILGVIASSAAVATTMLSIVVLGWILLAAGAGLVLLSFLTGEWSGFLLTLAAGVLSVIAGVAMLTFPVSGAVAITFMIGTVLIAAGIFRSVASAVVQFPNWGWSLVSGIAAFGLGVLVLRGWQTTSLWLLGLAIGIELILHGFAWIMFSLRVHSLAAEMGTTQARRVA